MSECAFGPHAALACLCVYARRQAKKPEMLMYNMYTPLSELLATLPAVASPPIPPCQGGTGGGGPTQGIAPRFGYGTVLRDCYNCKSIFLGI